MVNMADRNIAKTVAKLLVVVVAMFAFVFVVMVPLYELMCEELGINGKTSGERYEAKDLVADDSRTIRIQFVASNSDGMTWAFKPMQQVMMVKPGASNRAVFYAKNPLPKAMIGQAIPSVSPAQAAEYFHKTECFCFQQQPLGAGKDAELPVQFIIDKALPAEIKTITLSYTLFDVTDMAKTAEKTAAK
jgi:cytochrome c oxidase assembly protein subunit 11